MFCCWPTPTISGARSKVGFERQTGSDFPLPIPTILRRRALESDDPPKTIRGSGLLAHSNGFHAVIEIGHPLLRRLPADAYICTMVWIHCWVQRMEGRGNDRPLEAGSASCRVLFVVQLPPRGYCPRLLSCGAKKEGCDRPVSARFDLDVAISGIVRLGIVRLSVAAGRDQ
jgi:hypothetical protein